MKYYYGNSIKEALTNPPVEIKSTEVLENYIINYNVVMSETEAAKYSK